MPVLPRVLRFSARLTPTQRGIFFLLIALFFFSAMDAVAKGLVAHYPVVQVVWARNLFQTIAVLLLILPFGGLSQLKTKHPLNHLLRAIFQIATISLFFASLVYLSLTEAAALADTSPIFITLGAVLFLGEKLTRARIFALILAMIGTLIILRPGMGVFTPAGLLALGCAMAYAGNVLMTRKIGQHETAWTSLFYGALFGTLITSILLPMVWQPILAADIVRFLTLGALGSVAQWAVIRAFSISEAGAIAPFGYLGILFATFWSWSLFGTLPDVATVLGALVIIAAGLYVWREDRNLSRPPPAKVALV
jgi:drug/metabolite transporter (DMT)-like permease